MLMLTGIFATVAFGYGSYWGFYSRHHIDTDNAYVNGNVVQITPQIAGTVIGIGVDDTDFVKAGQLLVQLDPADSEVALSQAEAGLARTVRELRSAFSTNDSLGAQVAQRQAELARAQSDSARAQADYKRRKDMRASGAVSAEDLAHTESALRAAQAGQSAAQAGLEATREQLRASQAQTEQTSTQNHPAVLQAAAQLRAAYLGYARSRLPAPLSGYVAKRSVQLGQRVQPGAPLMAIVPLDALWVDANFKEVQLAKLRIGQPVELKADFYGSAVVYHGRVEGVAAGTGGAFSLLPAQNASGNWIKVVQRLPVRIALDPAELKAQPLRVGLSMHVDVDTSDSSGPQLAAAPRTQPAYETDVFAGLTGEADRRIHEIIAANSGGAFTAALPLPSVH
jgi:membrane fusion protein (multidrug efflux system)